MHHHNILNHKHIGARGDQGTYLLLIKKQTEWFKEVP
jgi:hypothetical protein